MTSVNIQTQNSDIINYFNKELSKHPSDINLNFKAKSNNSFIVYSNNENTQQFYNYISKLISSVILMYIEPILINRILNLDYCYFTKEEKKKILNKIVFEKNLDKILDKIHYKKLLLLPINNYISENNLINIEGFSNFRLSNFHSYIENIVEIEVHQFVINEEYLKFVNLIKEYVDSKIPDNTIVNLIYYNSTAILLSQNGEAIKLDNFNSIYLSDISFSNNDYVLNTLVGLLPACIEIHCIPIDRNDQFIKTIELIFGNKVHYCRGCPLCNSYKLGM